MEKETFIQDNLELAIDLDEELLDLPNLPCTENLMNDTSDVEHQDDVQIDDSVSNVSNVTADDRVGFESKEGSSFDENSLTEEVVEVCDAACQTEFTDSDSLSVKSNSLKSDSKVENLTVRVATSCGTRALHKRESTEAFLNATLQGTLLRKPDGASDPSLHKELLSSVVDCKQPDPLNETSSTLPRNTHLKTSTSALRPPTDLQTIKLQPYLSLPKQSTSQPSDSPPSSEQSPAQEDAKIIPPEPQANKPESRLKKLGLFRQHSNDNQDNQNSGKAAASNQGKKSKGSRLPGLRLPSKTKDSTPAKKTEPSKKVNIGVFFLFSLQCNIVT